ncbi:MAG: extracellular solute-binding protein, partial [Chloroflexota bacterium]|nr:extracellular solute-binding protein [Chloroflexota bacterium]
LDVAEAIESMTFLQALYEEGCIAPIVERSRTQATFGTGQLLFVTDSSSQLPRYQQAVEGGYGGSWGIAPLPHTTSEPRQTLFGPSLSIARSTPEQQLASWLFLKWLTEPPQQARWVRASHDLPVRQEAVAELEDYLTTYPSYESLLALLPYGQPEPTAPHYNTIRPLLEEALAQMVEGADAAETLTDLNEEIKVLYGALEP